MQSDKQQKASIRGVPKPKKKTNNGPKSQKKSGSNVKRVDVPIAKGIIVEQMNYNKNKTHVVKHREYVMDIQGSTSPFSVAQALQLNPGNPALFPWLSAMSNLYESYVFRKLEFIWEPSCPTITPGFVALCPDFNPLDAPPTGKVLAFQNEKCKRGSPFLAFALRCSQQELNKRKTYFARGQSEIVPNENKEVYDTGNLFVLVGGQSDNQTIGELWVDTIVEFSTPEAPLIPTGAFQAQNSDPSHMSQINPLGLGTDTTLINRQPDSCFRTSNNFGASSRIFFDRPFKGIVSNVLNGTGLGTLISTFGGGAQFLDGSYSGTATNTILNKTVATVAVDAPAGSYMDYVMTNPGALNIQSAFTSATNLAQDVFII